ncbi:hypothetical protein Vi05172_g12379 [Venturia inaequalis]|nr:hypothetical protein Vi05172_g12379 [Venturia inaequalis]
MPTPCSNLNLNLNYYFRTFLHEVFLQVRYPSIE